ncbi:bacterio-opsin activator domain-containing protein [Salinadaptatus halalkaliphilus]|nr:bacterio-opsin activator domain-containing protein [Salinadaptatus halalkaliphilus]
MDTDDSGSVSQPTGAEFYQTVVERAPVGVVTIDSENTIVDANAALERFVGYSPDELVGKHVCKLVPERSQSLETAASFGADGPEEGEIELPFTHRDGTDVAMIVRVDAYEYQDERIRTAFVWPRPDRTEGASVPADKHHDATDIDELFRSVAAEIVETSTRETIEQTVCEELAASEAYEFAWIAEVDRTTGDVTPRSMAGVEGYFSEIELTTDPDDPAGQGPGGKTLRTGQSHVLRNVFEEPSFEPWRSEAERYGFRSVAVVPISNGSTQYGALGIYSARVRAFGKRERTMVEQLGRLVGAAIASVEQQQALLTDSIVELEFRSRNVFQLFDRPVTADGAIALEHVVALDDESFLGYGTATAESMAVVEKLVDDDAIECVTSATVLHETDTATRFEVRLRDPPLLPTLTSHGAILETFRLAEGDLTMQIHAVPGRDIHQIVDAVTTTCPGAEMVGRRQRPQIARSPQELRQSLLDRLTARQQTALEAAYYGGFFEWPRERSGEDVAASLDINSSTFHQHVRKAENKLLDVLFEEQ